MAGAISVVVPGVIAYVWSRRVGVTVAVLAAAAALNVAARSLGPGARAGVLLLQVGCSWRYAFAYARAWLDAFACAGLCARICISRMGRHSVYAYPNARSSWSRSRACSRG